MNNLCTLFEIKTVFFTTIIFSADLQLKQLYIAFRLS
jgi:hypothetical protein